MKKDLSLGVACVITGNNDIAEHSDFQALELSGKTVIFYRGFVYAVRGINSDDRIWMLT